MLLFFISSGLFLGWTLGANDASNVFGSAVGSRLIQFKQAAIIACIFVVLGSVLQGSGGVNTLGNLGSVDALGGAFTVALAAGLAVFWMTKIDLPVSTSQAIVGAIIGWNFFTGNPTDYTSLTKIVTTWISGPILGGIFAVLLFLLLKFILKKTRIHLIKLDAYIKYGLLIVGAFGSFSLGANNIANVIGVFIPSAPNIILNFEFFTINGVQLMFLAGGVSIAAGIITYSKKVMMTVGNSLMKLNAETAIIVVLAHSLVLFIFSSQSLSNLFVHIGLPPIPLVPVSSSQAIIGAILGIGILKGGQTIKLDIIGKIVLGWLVTPIIAGLIAFFALFFMANVFNLTVSQNPTKFVKGDIVPDDIEIAKDSNVKRIEDFANKTNDSIAINLSKPAVIILVLVLLGIIVFQLFLIRRLKKKDKDFVYHELINKYNYQQKLLEDELNRSKVAKHILEREIIVRDIEQKKIALSIIEKNEPLLKVQEGFEKILQKPEKALSKEELNGISKLIIENLSIQKDRKFFENYMKEINTNFYKNLESQYPNLNEEEMNLCALIRLKLNTKQIAAILGVNQKECAKMKKELIKKMGLGEEKNLSKILRDF